MRVFLYMYLSKSQPNSHVFESSCLEALQAVLLRFYCIAIHYAVLSAYSVYLSAMLIKIT